jgi:hypothetical protein
MINRITMETVACLRNKCHLKQNLIPSWPWSFQHTSYISDFRCKIKYCRTPGLACLAVLPVLVIFCPLGPKVWRISKSLGYNDFSASLPTRENCSNLFWWVQKTFLKILLSPTIGKLWWVPTDNGESRTALIE